MKILLANPNSSVSVTEAILATARRSNPDPKTELVPLTNPKGTKGIDSTFADYQSAWSLHRAVLQELDKGGYDAVVIAGFGNLGINGLKEATCIPTLSISETSMAVASTLGHKFSILTTLNQFIPAQEDIVKLFGMENKCASVCAIDVSVKDCVEQREKTLRLLCNETRRIVAQDKAEVIILGSGGLSGYNLDVQDETHVTTLDPVQVTVKFAEMMVELGISHSKIKKFALPPQPLTNYFE